MFACEICGVKVGSDSSRKRHYDIFHGYHTKCSSCTIDRRLRAKSFCCSRCEPRRFFNTLCEHRRHVRDTHHHSTDSPPLVPCFICSCQLYSQRAFKLHLRKHLHVSSRLLFRCPFCSLEASTFEELTFHIQRHIPDQNRNKFICFICLQSLPSNQELIEHLQGPSHCKLASLQSTHIKCYFCNAVFTHISEHKLHIKSVHFTVFTTMLDVKLEQ